LATVIIRKPDGSSNVSFGAGIGKGLADHLYKSAFVNSDIFTTTALYLLVPGCKVIFSGNSLLMTTQNLTRTDFIISPKFIFTGSATDN